MTKLQVGFEGLTDGQVVPGGAKAAGFSGPSDTAHNINLGGGTAIARAAGALVGSRSLELDATATAHAPMVFYTGQAGSKTKVLQAVFAVDASDGVQFTIFQVRAATGGTAAVAASLAFAAPTDGTNYRIIMQDAGGSNVPTTNGVSAVQLVGPLGTKILVDVIIEQAATPTATNGRVAFRLRNLTTNTLICDYDSGYTTDVSTTLFNDDRLGKTGGSALTRLRVDNFISDDAPATVAFLPSPFVNTAPIADAGPDQTVAAGASFSLNGAGSTDPDGTIASYAWTQTSGATVTLTGTGATRTATAPATGPLVFSLVVTDNLGVASAPDTVTINVTPASSDVPQNFTSVAVVSGVSVVGVGATEAASDSNDATLLEFVNGGKVRYTLPRLVPPTGNLLAGFRVARLSGTSGSFSYELKDGATVVAIGSSSPAAVGGTVAEHTVSFPSASISGVTAAKWDAGTLTIEQTASAT